LIGLGGVCRQTQTELIGPASNQHPTTTARLPVSPSLVNERETWFERIATEEEEGTTRSNGKLEKTV
jgi:hypothetical protein